MKIQAIKKLCNEMGIYYLYDCDDGQQFLSDARAFWPVEGIHLTADMIPALFDISKKKQEDTIIKAWPCPDDERFSLVPVKEEEELKDLGTIYHSGEHIRVLCGQDGLIFINSELTKPGSNKEGRFAYSLRKYEGRVPVVACYGDMLVSALVLPIKGRGIMERLEKLSSYPLHVFWDEEEEDHHGE